MTNRTRERPRLTRPGSSVAIDPRRLMALRKLRPGLTRRKLSEAVTALGMADDDGNPVTLGQDILGKYETGARKPSVPAFAALCAALECEPVQLMPGGPPVDMPEEAVEREARLDYNRALRDFARAHGLKYKNRKTNRVYYRQELRVAYDRYLALLLARGARDPERLARAEAEFAAALAEAPRDPQANAGDSGVPLAS